MKKLKIIVLDQEENTALIECLQESLGSKSLAIARNVSVLYDKIESAPVIETPMVITARPTLNELKTLLA